jgi:hypothetical protein
LQNQRGGNLIDDAAVLLARVAGLIQNLMGFVGGKALVPKMNGQAGQLAERGGESLGFDGLRAEFATEMNRVADDDSGDFEAAAEPGEGAQIVAGVALAFQRENRLRGQAQRIRDRNPDAPVADVESEIAGFGSGFQRAAPAISRLGGSETRRLWLPAYSFRRSENACGRTRAVGSCSVRLRIR